MKLLESKNQIIEDENAENVPDLKITEVVLAHRDIVNNDYKHDSRFFYTFILNKRLFTKNNIFKNL